MEVSRRARRMDRHHKMGKGSPLNLVSLMDIFTILVFFLLVNSSNTQQLPSNKQLTLPKASTKKAPEETIVLAITKKDILVQGRKVASIADILSDDDESIPALQKELEFLSGAPVENNSEAPTEGKRITIMGDENVSYDTVRKILKTCQKANYTQVAFAATQVASKAQ
ncbi:MAG: biopolymer transporter ExbD [Agarilytica sp.]